MKIQKGVPFPTKTKQYPFSHMEIGDSIVDEDARSVKSSKLATAARNYSRYHNFKCTAITISGGVRIWRIK